MRRCLAIVAGLVLGSIPPPFYSTAASRALHEPAFRENFYGVKIYGQRAWIVGYYGTVLFSSDRGESWVLQRTHTRRALFRAEFVTDQKGWVSGSYGTLLHTSDGGKSWIGQNTGISDHLFGIDFVDDKNGWAVGSRGTILRTQDGGASWTQVSLREDVILNTVVFVTPHQGWIAGEFGAIYRTDDGGQTWSKQKSPVEVAFDSGENRNLFFLLFSNEQRGWAFGLDGTILETKDGVAWEIVHPSANPDSVTNRHLFAAALANGSLWAVGERGTAIRSEPEKKGWRSEEANFPPVSLNAIDFSADGFGLIVGNRGSILRSLDGGKQWQRLRLAKEAPGTKATRSP
jgi:photosystem II stability/assembly factor-like uncharacterized protein